MIRISKKNPAYWVLDGVFVELFNENYDRKKNITESKDVNELNSLKH